MRRFALLVACLGVLQIFAAKAQEVSLPKYSIGDSWSYARKDEWTQKIIAKSTQTIIGTNGDFVRVKYDSQSANQTTDQLGPLITSVNTQRSDFTQTFSAQGKIFRNVIFNFPLTVGKKWNDVFLIEIVQPTGLKIVFSYDDKAEIAAVEKITVPAGSFDAYKVVHKQTILNADGTGLKSLRTLIYWYVPIIKRYAKISDSTTLEDGTPQNSATDELLSYQIK